MENNFVLLFLFFFFTFNSLEYDENTSIIFRPNAKVMQCHLNLLFLHVYHLRISMVICGVLELSKTFTVEVVTKSACSSDTYDFRVSIMDAI